MTSSSARRRRWTVTSEWTDHVTPILDSESSTLGQRIGTEAWPAAARDRQRPSGKGVTSSKQGRHFEQPDSLKIYNLSVFPTVCLSPASKIAALCTQFFNRFVLSEILDFYEIQSNGFSSLLNKCLFRATASSRLLTNNYILI